MSFNLNKLVQPECGAPNALVRAAQQISSVQSTTPMTASVSRNLGPIGSIVAGSPSAQASQLNFAREFAHNEPPPLMRVGATAPKTHHVGASSQEATTTTNLMHNMNQLTLNQTQLPHQPMMSYSMHSAATFSANNQITFQQQATTSGNQQQQVSAGDQLEAKYRNDMISAHGGTGKLDDVEFWQALAQTYMGPSTYDNIARARSTNKKSDLEEDRKSSLEQVNESDKNTRSNLLEESLEINSEQYLSAVDHYTGDYNSFLDKLTIEYHFDEKNPLKDQFDDPFTEGLKRLEQGDIPSAVLLFEAAVDREPENALAWRYLGTTQAQNEQDGMAINALYMCLKQDKSDQQARLAISVSLANDKRDKEALIHLLDWLISHERYKSIQANHSEFNQIGKNRNRPESGEGKYSSYRYFSNDDNSYYYDENIYPEITESISQPRESKYGYVCDRFIEAARMSPNNPDPDVQGALGLLFNMNGSYDKAKDCFQAALSIKSDDSLLWNRLGATLANSNRCEEAVVAYKRALEIAPGFLRSRYNLAISLVHLNYYGEAAKQLVQILNTQMAGVAESSNLDAAKRRRIGMITSVSIWNTLKTVATLMNRPDLYTVIDNCDLKKCNEIFLSSSISTPPSSSAQAS